MATIEDLLALEETPQAGQPAPQGVTVEDLIALSDDGPAWWENIWGRGEADTPGERLGQTINDAGRAAIAGAQRGYTSLADLPGVVVNALGNRAVDAIDAVADLPDGVEQGARQSLAATPVGSGRTMRKGAEAVSPVPLDYEPKTQAGRYAGTIAEFLPTIHMPGAQVGAHVVAPGAVSEFAGQQFEGKQIPDWVPLIGGQDAEPFARVGGALVGPGLYERARRTVTPNPADPARIRAANRLKDEGITTTAGQRTDSPMTRFREASTRYGYETAGNQNEQFTAAALRRIAARNVDDQGRVMDAPATRATPEVLRQASDDIGQLFKRVEQGASFTPTANMATQMRDALNRYKQLVNKNQRSPLLKATVSKIEDALDEGRSITGKEYTSWRSQLSEATAGSDSFLRGAALKYIDELDRAVGRSLIERGDNELLRTYTTARQRWQDYLAIQKAASMKGAESGVISPGQLRSGVSTGSQRGSYARSQRDIQGLTRDANEVMAPLNDPQQDALRSRVFTEMMGGGGIAGGGAAMATGDPLIGGAVGAASFGVPYIANRAVGTRAGQAYLGNQLMTGTNGALAPQTWPVLTGLLAEEQTAGR